jgi:hypothetical protein
MLVALLKTLSVTDNYSSGKHEQRQIRFQPNYGFYPQKAV